MLEGAPGDCLVQPPYSKQGHLEQVVQNCVQSGFACFQDSAAGPGNLFKCSIILTVKKLFLVFKLNFLNCGLCPFPLVLSLSITDKSLALSSLLPPIRYLCILIRPPPSFLFSQQRKTVPALSDPTCTNPLLIFVVLC